MTDMLDGNGISREDLQTLAAFIDSHPILPPRPARAAVKALRKIAEKAGPYDYFAIDVRKVRG